MTINEMLATYHAHSAASLYYLGFVLNGLVYTAQLSFDELVTYCKLDHTSSARGGYAKIRIRIGKRAACELVLSGKATAIAYEEELKPENNKYNRGENYERIITEQAGQTWVKDRIPFWVAGDIEINGIQIQIKLNGATLVEEPTLVREFSLT